MKQKLITLTIGLTLCTAVVAGLHNHNTSTAAAAVPTITEQDSAPALTRYYKALDNYAGKSNYTDADEREFKAAAAALDAAGYIKVYQHPDNPVEAESSFEKADSEAARAQVAYNAAVAEQNSAPMVSSAALFAQYDQNEVRADNQYQGKLIKLTGTVSTITKDFNDKPVVALRTEDLTGVFTTTVVNVPAADLASLNPGDTVTVVCKVVGKRVLGPVCDAGY